MVYNKIIFTEDQKQFMRENFNSMTNLQMAQYFELKLTRVRTEMYRMGLKKLELEFWTPKQIDYLKKNFQKKGDAEISDHFNKTYSKNKGWHKKHIEKKRRYLQLKRTPEEIKLIHLRNVKKGRFKMCPVNAWKTRGSNPEGTIVTWTNQIGQQMNHIKTKKGYQLYHRVIWQNTYGRIKKGYNVSFKDGNPLNCTLENLELLSRADHARKNARKRMEYPPEIREIMKLNNKVRKKIKEINNQNTQYGKK